MYHAVLRFQSSHAFRVSAYARVAWLRSMGDKDWDWARAHMLFAAISVTIVWVGSPRDARAALNWATVNAASGDGDDVRRVREPKP